MDTSERAVHRDSRLSALFSEGPLETETGQSTGNWARYAAKELIDNALEASENPTIDVDLEVEDKNARVVTVTDDGPGLSDEQVRRIFGDLDSYDSTKRHYKTPTRGDQGNALMTLFGMQHVVNSDVPLEVHSQNTEYRISVVEDNLGEYAAQFETDYSNVDGFSVTVDFGDAVEKYAKESVKSAFKQFVMLNPQATLQYQGTTYDALDVSTMVPANDREKATWFTSDDFRSRLKADAGADENMTGRQFLEQFYGIRDSDNLIGVETSSGLNGNRSLHKQLTTGDLTDLKIERVHRLLSQFTDSYSWKEMDQELGCIGEDLQSRLVQYVEDDIPDCVDTDDMTVYYNDGLLDDYDGKTVPSHFELAVVPTGIKEKHETPEVDVVFGINQSVVYSQPSFEPNIDVQHHGGKTNTQHSTIENAFAEIGHDFAVVGNLICPNVDFNDGSKQSFDMEPFRRNIDSMIGRAIRKTEKDVRPALNRQRVGKDEEKLNNKAEHGFIKGFIFENFWDVYNEATDDGAIPLEMRQFFYVMRPPLEAEGKRRGYEYASNAYVGRETKFKLRYGTFDENVSKFEEEVLGERLIHRDGRGFFVEPRSNDRVELDTVTIRDYEPTEQYGDVLFVEKSGFDEVLRQTGILDRYDIGLINGKGWNTIAGQDLIEKIQLNNPESRLFTLTDMDIAGVGIAAAAKDTDTISEISDMDELNTIRLGVTMDDIEQYDLSIEEEPDYKAKQLSALETRWENGDIDRKTYEFLVDDNRVEINAIPPNVLSDYLEAKFEEYGVEKMVPDSPESIDLENAPDNDEVHRDAVKMIYGTWMESLLPDTIRNAIAENVAKPEDLEGDPEAMYDKITEQLTDYPPEHWEDIAEEMVEELRDDADEYTEDAVEEGVEYLEDNHSIAFD